MRIGIPKEVKNNEYRVALSPQAVRDLARHHQVMVEKGAGLGSGFEDVEYANVGATIVDSAAEVWNSAEMILKVKEPLPEEYPFLREDLILFTYLHLAANETLTNAMLESGITALAYETVEVNGMLPLLEPMSEVAGRMSSQILAHYLQQPEGERGILMGGVPGVRPAQIVILGAGTVGMNAAQIALGMGAEVTLIDINLERLRYLQHVLQGRIKTLYSNNANIADAIESADGVVGAVLIAGARAPHLITREMLCSMPRGSVIVDVAVDQGGCVETTHVTTHSEPIYTVDGVVHYGVSNMPGAVPRTSSFALANASLRYIRRVADLGVFDAMRQDAPLAKGLNVHRGKITHPAVAQSFGLPVQSVNTLL